MTANSPDNAFEQEARREALLTLYKNTPAVAVIHIIAAAAVVYAFSLVISLQALSIWWTGLTLTAIARIIVTLKFMQRWPIDDAALPAWIKTQSLLAFILTAFWGSTAFIIWPDAGEYRTLLIAILIGIVSAGGVVLATQLRSFLFYCGPILLPLIYQLLQAGERLQEILVGMLVLYVAVLVIAISRLERTFLDGVRLRLQMHALSKTDVLTNLANRRGFDDYLNDVWQNAVRSSQPIGLIMADVDFFKDYNDQYGHPAGDEALTRVAEFLRSVASRGTDLCARVGVKSSLW
jgi:GGDEF domain-containing protein